MGFHNNHRNEKRRKRLWCIIIPACQKQYDLLLLLDANFVSTCLQVINVPLEFEKELERFLLDSCMVSFADNSGCIIFPSAKFMLLCLSIKEYVL